MDKLTSYERAFCRKAGITAADVFTDGANSCGRVYGLYNPFYYVRVTASGYSKSEIYRFLVRELIRKIGIVEQ